MAFSRENEFFLAPQTMERDFRARRRPEASPENPDGITPPGTRRITGLVRQKAAGPETFPTLKLPVRVTRCTQGDVFAGALVVVWAVVFVGPAWYLLVDWPSMSCRLL